MPIRTEIRQAAPSLAERSQSDRSAAEDSFAVGALVVQHLQDDADGLHDEHAAGDQQHDFLKNHRQRYSGDQNSCFMLPDGFDEQTSILYGMAAIALAFGVDARELFPAMSAGATRADALLQHLKQRGKGPGQILQMTEQ